MFALTQDEEPHLSGLYINFRTVGEGVRWACMEEGDYLLSILAIYFHGKGKFNVNNTPDFSPSASYSSLQGSTSNF